MRHKQQGVQRRGGRRGTPRRRSAPSWAQGHRGLAWAIDVGVSSRVRSPSLGRRRASQIATHWLHVFRRQMPLAAVIREAHRSRHVQDGPPNARHARTDVARHWVSAPPCVPVCFGGAQGVCALVFSSDVTRGERIATRTTSDRCAALSAAPGTSTLMMPCVPRSIIPSRSARKRRRPCDHRVALEPAAPCPTPQTREKVSP